MYPVNFEHVTEHAWKSHLLWAPHALSCIAIDATMGQCNWDRSSNVTSLQEAP